MYQLDDSNETEEDQPQREEFVRLFFFFFKILSIHLTGGHGGLRYRGIELFFKRYFENFDFNVWYCGIIQPCGMRWFFTLLANGIR